MTDLYIPSKNLSGYYVKTNGLLDGAGLPAWRVAVLEITPGKTYEMRLATPGPYTLGLYGAPGGLPGGAIAGAKVVLYDSSPGYKRFTVPTSPPIGTMFFNVNVADNDLTGTFSVKEVLPSNRWGFFGDSITAGSAEGSYVTYAAEKMGVEPVNYGSSGARASRLVGIMTDQPRRDGVTGTFPLVDYTDLKGVSIAIGTNDSYDGGGVVTGSLADIPSQSVFDVPYSLAGTAAAHWARFPDTFYGNLALCIEYVKWKNPSIPVYLLVHPHVYDVANKVPLLSRMDSVAKAMKEIGEKYSVPVLDARLEGGIPAKNKPVYAPDGVHYNSLGNKVLGEFYGRMK